MRAAIYLRVSGEEQAQHGYSIAAQRRSCRERAQRLGAQEIMEYRDEGISASVLERPGLLALRAAVGRREVDLVVIHDPDRFARNLSHQLLVTEEIERAGVTLDFVNFEWQHTPEGKLFYALRGAIAEYEREKIRLRTMSGRAQKAREGKLPFGFAPYGYRYVPERSQLEVVEEEARVVRFIFDQYTGAGRGLNGIARELTRSGVPTRKNRAAWHRQVVRQIVRNPVYTGIYHANRRDMAGMALNRFRPSGEKVRTRERDPAEWIPVKVPVLVDGAQWLEAQRLMAEHARVLGARPSDYLLSGLLRCESCGQTMTGRRGRSWGRAVRAYTCRKHTAGARSPGCGRQVDAAAVEEAVWARVMAWLDDPGEVAARLAAGPDTGALELERAAGEAELKRVDRGRRELLRVLERGLARAEDVTEGLDRLALRERSLRARIGQIEAQLDRCAMGGPEPGAIREAAVLGLDAARRSLPADLRRRIVRELVAGVAVGAHTLTVRARIARGCPEEPAGGSFRASGSWQTRSSCT